MLKFCFLKRCLESFLFMPLAVLNKAIGCFKQSHRLFYIKPLAVGGATDVRVIGVVKVVVSLAV